MNYHKIYEQLMTIGTDAEYTEKHHIVPKCMGGSDDPENLVELSARQHFIAHLLLVKMYPGNHKLIYAANMLTVGTSRSSARTANRRYGWLKEKALEAQKQKEFSEETRLRMRQAKLQQNRVTCPHCNTSGLVGNMNRWHFDNCKHKPGNEGKVNAFAGVMRAHKNSNVVSERGSCPHCGTESTVHYLNSHIPYCTQNPDRKTQKKREQLTCPHCAKVGDATNMKRWHFDNCKFKTS
ncbi:hypothetical protein phi5_244 [Enterobacter phage phi5]|jgi:endogenous inhibitor of DNA gyrase (YacG/DUF329 family)|nr:hypothetical protein phi5_244 [Enterobacter phage phi5]